MARYRVERRGLVWICEVTLENDAIVAREWREGHEGGPARRQVYASPAEAKRRYVAHLAALRQEKARPLAPSASDGGAGARDEALEAELRRDPDSLDAYLVYADWLQLAGDPRGELITLQVGREQRPKDRALQRRERELLAEHGEALLGPLRAPLDASDEKWPIAAVQWRRGFWRSMLLTSRRRQPLDVVGVLTRALRHASARFLEELVVARVDPRQGDDDAVGVIRRLAPALRRLSLGDVRPSGDDYLMGCFDPRHWGLLLPSLPSLRELVLAIEGNRIVDLDAPLRHASLELLDLTEDRTSDANLARILDAELPALTTLRLALGPNDAYNIYGLEAILNGTRFPRLRHLALRRTTFGDNLCQVLVGCALLPRLETLDLAGGNITDAGAAALAAHRPRMRHLRRLAIQRNQLSQAGVQLLRGVAAEVVTDRNEL